MALDALGPVRANKPVFRVEMAGDAIDASLGHDVLGDLDAFENPALVKGL
jgi:hypothetical protein